ncbi:hypothetical protein TSUD_86970 [Trifolium subterraneum]|uniref:RNase H type-1 domain-containing protein n=1 Tax=Trifolium subterraneum TaxID=3900 RepID=A0A2Z6NN36_TRISU|nr:hypothetical protein TSUD_86970 [Trifolium subterraneum]
MKILEQARALVDTTLTIKDVITITGQWNIDFIQSHLPHAKANQVLALLAPMNADGPDSLDGKALVLATSRFKVPTNFNVETLTILRGIGKRYGTGKGMGLQEPHQSGAWNTQRGMTIYIHVIHRADHLHQTGGLRHFDTVYIGWKRPQGNWVKLNSDGAYKESCLDLAGCGSLIRDSDGQWLTGYTRKIGTCDALHAVMWGMYEGLKIARRHGFSHLVVESDSKLLVNMVTNNCKINGAILVPIRRI